MAIGVKRIDLATAPEWVRGMAGLAAERQPWANLSVDEIASLRRLETWSDVIHQSVAAEITEDLSPRWIWLLLTQVSWQRASWEDSSSALRWIENSAPPALTPFWKAFSAWQRDHAAARWHELVPYLVEATAGQPLAEWWLQTTAPATRSQYGVYFTPPALSDRLWAEIEKVDPSMVALSPDSSTCGGETWRWLDPASGSQVFLVAGLQRLASRCQHDVDSQARDWLSRTVTFELSPLAWILGFIEIARAFEAAGGDLSKPVKLHCWLTDALSPAAASDPCDSAEYRADKADQSFRWIVGNPPYSSRVEQAHPWSDRLLHGLEPGVGGAINYFECSGEPIRERKNWLHDLYVRFLRLGQWAHAEAEVRGMGFVINQGFAENKSFRGMRESLCNSFDQVSIQPLHSVTIDEKDVIPVHEERKSKSKRDSWFEIKTPTCLAIFFLSEESSSSTGLGNTEVNRVDSPERPLARVTWHAQQADEAHAHDVSESQFTPIPPGFEFSPSASHHREAFEQGVCLTEIFDQVGSTIVTARDALVIASERDDLIRRLNDLTDLSVPDALIRERFFRKSRSRRFEPGDTRSWRLAEVRKSLANKRAANSRFVESLVKRCQYRVLDHRWIAWDPDLIDWPRREVMGSLVEGRGLAIIARRQSPTDRPANFYCATKHLVVDGVLRSDNRGNESVFNLRTGTGEASRSNLRRSFIECLERQWNATWVSMGKGSPAVKRVIDEHFVASYIYGWLQTPIFQEFFREQLTRHYPRIPIEVDWLTAKAFAADGARLLELHTSVLGGEEGARECEARNGFIKRNEVGETFFNQRAPYYDGNRVQIAPLAASVQVPQSVWELRLGKHQPASKWLKDRWNSLEKRDLTAYSELVAKLAETLEIQKRLGQTAAAYFANR